MSLPNLWDIPILLLLCLDRYHIRLRYWMDARTKPCGVDRMGVVE